MPYPSALGATPTAATVDANNPDAVAAAIGAVLPSGYASWSDYLTRAGNGLNPAANYYNPLPFVGSPSAAAFAAVWNAMHVQAGGHYTPTAAEIVAQLAPPGARPASVPVPDSAWAQYAAAVQLFAPRIYQVWATYAPGQLRPTSAQTAILTGDQAWRAALTAGAWTAPPEWWAYEFGGQGSHPAQQIPLQYVFFGPTTQPDGMVVLAWNDPRDGKDYVYRWPGPTFKPVHLTFPSANPSAVTRFNMDSQPQNVQNVNPWVLDSNGDMVQLPDPGTGDWSGIDLLPSRVQALFLSQGTPTLVNPLTLAPIAPPPQTPYAVPPVVIATPPPVLLSVDTSTPIITQDEQGNVIAGASSDVTMAPPVTISTLPSGVALTATPTNYTPFLVAGGVVAALYLLSSRRG